MLMTHGRNALSCVFIVCETLQRASQRCLVRKVECIRNDVQDGSFHDQSVCRRIADRTEKAPMYGADSDACPPGQVEEDYMSVIAMAETAVRRLDPPMSKNRELALFRIFQSSKFVSNALPRLQRRVQRSGRIRQ